MCKFWFFSGHICYASPVRYGSGRLFTHWCLLRFRRYFIYT